jgi:L-amino acid N-acyltransferase YncA
VDTHPDHQQRGLRRAVVGFAAHHMAAAGMEYAIVANFESNAASGALDRSAGFEPWHVLDGYEKPISG